MKLMNLFEHWQAKSQTKETRESFINNFGMLMTHGGQQLLEDEAFLAPTLQMIDTLDKCRARILQPTGRMQASLAPNYRHFGIFPLKLKIENLSFEDWNLEEHNPIFLRYRVTTPNGDMKIKAGPNKKLPEGRINRRQFRELELSVSIDPDEIEPGDLLILTLYQHGTGWFDNKGFTPATIKLPQ